jgi:hypothetical protein
MKCRAHWVWVQGCDVFCMLWKNLAEKMRRKNAIGTLAFAEREQGKYF